MRIPTCSGVVYPSMADALCINTDRALEMQVHNNKTEERRARGIVKGMRIKFSAEVPKLFTRCFPEESATSCINVNFHGKLR